MDGGVTIRPYRSEDERGWVVCRVLSFLDSAFHDQSLTFPGEAAFAATIAGHFAVGAPGPLPAWAELGSTFLEDITSDLAHALRWAAELLDLPSLS